MVAGWVHTLLYGVGVVVAIGLAVTAGVVGITVWRTLRGIGR